jgi:single-strand DNA-binding protein
VNKVILCGNLGADPELKYTPSNQALLRLRLATTEKWKDKGGELQEKTAWHTVVVWGARAEALAKFLTKGHRLLVEGSLEYREWEADDGSKRHAVDVRAIDIEVCGGGERREQPQRQEQPKASAPKKSAADYEDF